MENRKNKLEKYSYLANIYIPIRLVCYNSYGKIACFLNTSTMSSIDIYVKTSIKQIRMMDTDYNYDRIVYYDNKK